MQTATSVVTNTLSSPLTVCIMFNSGNQRIYVTENLARNLNLHLSTPEKLAVVIFGIDRPKYLQYTCSEGWQTDDLRCQCSPQHIGENTVLLKCNVALVHALAKL